MATLTLCFGGSAFAYPFSQDDIKQLLEEEAQYQGVSPSLVLAIAKVESDFNPSALSHAGAKGVMQIMPATAKNGFQVEGHELFNAKVNIRVGVAFIKQLLEQYNGQVDIALSHYNGGSRVKRPNGALGVIPATRVYVNKVKMYAQRYKNQGYDGRPGLTEGGTLTHRQSNERLSLSYAQQIALDELDYRDMAMQSVASLLEVEKNRPNPRINQLQDLRVHNLTRLLPAKKAKVEINTADDVSKTVLAGRVTKLVSIPFIRGPKQSHKESLVPEADMPRTDLRLAKLPRAYDLTIKPVPLQYAGSRQQQFVYEKPIKPVSLQYAGSKQQQVASWEAIFD